MSYVCGMHFDFLINKEQVRGNDWKMLSGLSCIIKDRGALIMANKL